MAPIKIRLDVDYPYPSRFKSFIYTAAKRKKPDKDYLKNPKILAKMINESSIDIRAYWFFTPYTIPDKELLLMLTPEKHEVALHVANNPYEELAELEKITGRRIEYYTIHGTARLLARLMWRRKVWQAQAVIPNDFPLQSFHIYPKIGLDVLCYHELAKQATIKAKEAINKKEVLHVHPEWLFQRGTINHRGPYYQVLKNILEVDKDIEELSISKKSFFKSAHYAEEVEYKKDFTPKDALLGKLADRGVDVFSFIERSWCSKINDIPKGAIKTEDNIALLQITNYIDWWNGIKKKTRNMIRKAEKSGEVTRLVEPTKEFVEGIWKIYIETPIRQGRVFPHYGATLKSVEDAILNNKESTFIGSYFEGELVGFIQLDHGDNLTVISQILSLQKQWDKAVNNALIAKAVEVCADKQIRYIMYGRIGNHPSLDSFKQSNNFTKFVFPRYFVPLTRKGRLAIKLHLHRPLKDKLPTRLKKPLFPLFNWVSRTKIKTRNRHQ